VAILEIVTFDNITYVVIILGTFYFIYTPLLRKVSFSGLAQIVTPSKALQYK
jgi:hypothetical protein